MTAGYFKPRDLDLQPQQWWEALRLWQAGYDTLALASIFGVHEAVIYNGLPHYRERLGERRRA